ncbi:hypothetical protein DDR33_17525 [Pararcticibacter amylolyticus]|uniref:Uncharacterized protein n=2 Tax=Pararcticibacter amylolyticus TaxID=2173175 RepID=A0A2U2PD89_9SPHI|nr:hypothetical protein DDR33_17525 [Pararcticibacter amylolyticus]
MTNCRFSVPANSTRGISTYYFNGYYTQAYDQGGILVYIRETNDPSGKWYNAFDKSNDLLITNPFGSVKIYGDAANSGKLGLTFVAWTQSGQTQAVTECRFDQKIILLLPNTLSMMKAANVNSNNMAEVEKFLKRTSLK